MDACPCVCRGGGSVFLPRSVLWGGGGGFCLSLESKSRDTHMHTISVLLAVTLTVWNWTRPKAPVQNQQTGEWTSALRCQTNTTTNSWVTYSNTRGMQVNKYKVHKPHQSPLFVILLAVMLCSIVLCCMHIHAITCTFMSVYLCLSNCRFMERRPSTWWSRLSAPSRLGRTTTL